RSHHYPSRVESYVHEPATTQIYTLSLHDALPIYILDRTRELAVDLYVLVPVGAAKHRAHVGDMTERPDPLVRETVVVARLLFLRSEEHTSELQSRRDLVCRLLLEKKKNSNADSAG